MLGTDRRDGFVTTDLLSEWTDPDTAMEAVGASLGRLGDRASDARRRLSSETPLRDELYDVLLGLVDDGSLEKRATADGRYAFRWRRDTAPVVRPAPVATAPGPTPAPVRPAPESPETVAPETVAPETVAPGSPERDRPWPRLLAPSAPLLLPAVSCVLALLVFVWLARGVALVIAAALIVLGVVGLVRRVPFAGLWTTGLIIAVLLLRLS